LHSNFYPGKRPLNSCEPKPDKEKSTEKIDDAIAMIMVLDRAIRCGCVSDDSIYDSRDM